MAIKDFCSYLINAFTQRKSVHVSADKTTNLDRCLSTSDLIFIGVGSTFGGGVYLLTGEVAKDKAGPAVIFSFCITATASILTGLCYAELGTRFPKAGSAYVYCYVAMGEIVAFFTGWNLVGEYLFGGAAVIKGGSVYIDSLFNGAIRNTTISITGEIQVPGLSSYFDFVALLITFVFSIFLAIGIRLSSRLITLLTIFNLVSILFCTGFGFVHAEPGNWSNFAPYGVKGVIRGAVTCFYTFIGFDVITITGQEAKNPDKSIPYSILGTIAICSSVYVSFGAALTLLVPYKDLTWIAGIAFAQRNLIHMRYVVGGSAIIGLLCCSFVTLIGTPRLLYALSTDGLLPSIFSKINTKTKTPVFGTIVSEILIALLAAVLELDSLVNMHSIGTLFGFSMVDIAVLVLRYQPRQDLEVNNNLPMSAMLSKQDVSFWKRITYSPIFVNLVIFGMIVEIIGFCILTSMFSEQLFNEISPVYLSLWIALAICIIGSGILLQLRPSNTEDLHLFVPCMPWIPIAGIIFNVNLLIELNFSKWMRYCAVVVLGLFVYFGFSIHYSAEGNGSYKPITTIDPDEGEENVKDD